MSEGFAPFVASTAAQGFMPYMLLQEHHSATDEVMSDTADSKYAENIAQAYEKGFDEAQKIYDASEAQHAEHIAAFLDNARVQLHIDAEYIGRMLLQKITAMAAELDLVVRDDPDFLMAELQKAITSLGDTGLKYIHLHPSTEPLWADIKQRTGIEVQALDGDDQHHLVIGYEGGFLEYKTAERLALFKAYCDALD